MKPYIFVIFQWGSGPPVPPLDPHMAMDTAGTVSAVQQQAVQGNKTYKGLSPPVKYFY